MPLQTRGVGIGQRRGNLKWTPSLQAVARGITDLRNPIVDECFARTEILRKEIQAYARDNAPWEDQTPEERKGYTGPHARSGLFAFKERQKSGIVIGLTHGPRTISPRQGFPYGIALETFKYTTHEIKGQLGEAGGGNRPTHINIMIQTEGEGTYATINPTLQNFYPTVMRRLDGALNAAIGGSGKTGGSRVFRR